MTILSPRSQLLLIAVLVTGCFAILPSTSLAQSTEATIVDDVTARPAPTIEFFKVRVSGTTVSTNEYGQPETTIAGTGLSSAIRDEVISLTYFKPENGNEEFTLAPGDTIVASRTTYPDTGEVQWAMSDRYRLPGMMLIFLIFVALAIIFGGGRRGISALAGLGFSVVMLVWFIVPQLAHSSNPLLIGLLGALIISVVSMFMAHGFNRLTSISVISTLITIGLTMFLAWVSIQISGLFGTGSEEAYMLQQFSSLGDIDLRGLLLVGIVIGALGVLDDVTTSLTASIAELHAVNPTLTFQRLFQSGLRIGREHITSLVNTLVLAYAGASLPVLLFFSVDPRPFWVLLNSQFMAEEVIRALVGSVALMMAVPISAVLAAYMYRTNVVPNVKGFK